MHLTETIYPYYKIIRPLNTVLAGIGVYIGLLITLGLQQIKNEILIISVGAIIMICVSAGGFIVNDIFDLEIDKINMPHRILPSGQLSLKSAYFYATILFLVAFLLSILSFLFPTNLKLGLIPPLITIFGIVSLILYAGIFKRYSIIGNILISILSAVPFLIGGLLGYDFNRAIFPVLVTLFLVYSRELIKDVEDIRGDVEGSDGSFYSLPAIIGVRNSIFIACVTLVLLIITTLFPFILSDDFQYYKSYSVLFFAILVDFIVVFVIYSILISLNDANKLHISAKKGRRLLKICVALGLATFLFNEFTLIN